MHKNVIFLVVLSFVTSIVVFFGGNTILGEFNNKKVASVDVSEEYELLAGVIRNTGDGWSLIQDDDHETIGIESVTQNEEKIIVKYREKTKVNSIAVTVDETMAADGYTVGASVGTNETWILIYDENGKKINPKDYKNNLGNIWIQGFFKK